MKKFIIIAVILIIVIGGGIFWYKYSQNKKREELTKQILANPKISVKKEVLDKMSIDELEEFNEKGKNVPTGQTLTKI